MSTETTRVFTIGESAVFAFDVPFFAPSEIACYIAAGQGEDEVVTQLVRGVDFAVQTLDDYSSGANITLIAGNNIPTLAAAVGKKLTIARIVELERQFDLMPNSKISSRALNNQLEQIVRMAQQLEDALRRCIAVPIGATTRTPEGILASIYASDRNAANSAANAANSAANAANSAGIAGSSAVNAAEAAARALTLAAQIGSMDFTLYAEYLAGTNPGFNHLYAGNGVVEIDPANGAYQTIQVTPDMYTLDSVTLVPTYSRIEDIQLRKFIFLTVSLFNGNNRECSLYFKYEASGTPVFITKTQGVYQVMLVNISNTVNEPRWVIGHWGKMFDVEFTAADSNNSN